MLLAGVLSTALAAQAAAPAAKPNIVFVMADDLGWKDVGFHGSDILTPNLDRLAEQGVEFAQLYALPMCTPTRAALMTGRYPFRYGLQTGVIPAGEKYGLPLDEWLLPQALAQAGYDTVMVGKWHLGHGDRAYWPRQRGFRHHYGPLIGEIDYFTHEAAGVVDWQRDNVIVKEPGYSTTLLGEAAVQTIRAHDPAQPLFLYLAFNAPHTPYQAPQEYLDRYPKIEDPNRKAYAASITALDEQVGRVMKALDEKGMSENTLIVFMSDNGGTRNPMFSGAIADVSKCKIPCDNGPYREGKGSNYEGGTRVVGFANWPRHICPGTKMEGPMHVVDWFPTLVALAGGSIEKSKPLDGMNLWLSITEGQPSPRTEIVYNIEPFRAAVREDDWKLVWKPTLPPSVELFDLAHDPGEKHNLAASQSDKVAALEKRAAELSTQAAKPKLLEIGFHTIVEQFHLPPAFPGEEYEFSNEH